MALHPPEDLLGLEPQLVPLAEVVQSTKALRSLPHLGICSPRACENSIASPQAVSASRNGLEVETRLCEVVHRDRSRSPETEAKAEIARSFGVVESTPGRPSSPNGRTGHEKGHDVLDAELGGKGQPLLHESRRLLVRDRPRWPRDAPRRAVRGDELGARVALENGDRLVSELPRGVDLSLRPHRLREGLSVNRRSRRDPRVRSTAIGISESVRRLVDLAPLDEDARRAPSDARPSACSSSSTSSTARR